MPRLTARSTGLAQEDVRKYFETWALGQGPSEPPPWNIPVGINKSELFTGLGSVAAEMSQPFDLVILETCHGALTLVTATLPNVHLLRTVATSGDLTLGYESIDYSRVLARAQHQDFAGGLLAELQRVGMVLYGVRSKS